MDPENPCLKCTINQDCCAALVGLRVTEKEYQQCFEHHADGGKFTLGREGPVYIINPDEKQPCPNWTLEGCSVYENRPLECRLFPHTLYIKSQHNSQVQVRFHAVYSCPQVDTLRWKEAVAEKMVSDFCEEAFPSDWKVTVKLESIAEKAIRKLAMLRKKFTRRFRQLLGQRNQ